MLTVKQAAERLGLSIRRVQDLCKEGKIKATEQDVVIRKRYLIDEQELERYQKEKK